MAAMDTPLAPGLIDRLSAMRFSPEGVRAVAGIGERASRARGPGMEFADFRAYRAGDDLRHVDPRSLMRGQPLTREYMQRRQLSVTVVVDRTLSMTTGDGGKARLATSLAQALGFIALAGQDRLRLVALEQDGTVLRSPVWQGRNRATEMFAFSAAPLAKTAGGTESDALATTIASLLPSADSGSVIVLLSDFWGTDIVDALTGLAASPAMVVALQVLAAEERDPALLGRGIMRLADAETGAERDISLDEEMLSRYRAALASHQDKLAETLSGGQHVFMPLDAQEPLSAICLEKLPATGVIS
jgi:uncharacterized protein (DUF58 family)